MPRPSLTTELDPKTSIQVDGETGPIQLFSGLHLGYRHSLHSYTRYTHIYTHHIYTYTYYTHVHIHTTHTVNLTRKVKVSPTYYYHSLQPFLNKLDMGRMSKTIAEAAGSLSWELLCYSGCRVAASLGPALTGRYTSVKSFGNSFPTR